MDVYAASASKFEGPTPSIEREWLDQVKANILTFFRQRAYWDSSEPIPQEEHFGSLTFSWGIK
jgi:hypothetical protein